jgi:hypothetical protein
MKPDFDSMVINILAAYADANTDERKAGFDWYPQAYEFCQNLANEFPISVEQVAAVTAALSPQKDWISNQVWADEIIRSFFGSMIFRSRGLGNSFRRAMIALNGDLSDIERESGTLKVNRFYHSILGDAGYATIDRHAIRVAYGDFVSSPPSISDGTYREIERAYIEASRELRKGTRHIQAVTWIVCRRERGLIEDPNKYARQAAKRRHPSSQRKIVSG